MKRHDKGFIFIVTLLIITVISLLLLTSMQHILLYHKAINKQEALHQNFYQLENIATQLAHMRLTSIDQACVVHDDSPNRVIQNLLHHKGCPLEIGLLHYQYLIEDLGNFPCLVAHHKGRKRGTHHHRVSVIQIKDGVPMSLLQIRYISAGGVLICRAKEHSTPLGVSSWRYFPSV